MAHKISSWPVPRPAAPFEPPQTSGVRASMVGNRGKDTQPEIAVRSLLHSMGLRFRKNTQPITGLRCNADIVFRREQIAIFIDGCFWHGCPQHGREPQANSLYWREKFEHNQARDHRNNAFLCEAGWLVLRYWEHEPSTQVANEIRRCVLAARSTQA